MPTHELYTVRYISSKHQHPRYINCLHKMLVSVIFYHVLYILGDCTIPAGANIAVNIAGLHYNPTEFPEPYKFDPERFSPDRVANMKRFSYLPFGAGSRICIGMYCWIY